MDSTLIKSFLVGLGFSVDQNQLRQFNKSIVTAGIKILALYEAAKLAAQGIKFAVKSLALGFSQVSESFEQLGYDYRLIAPLINKTLYLRQVMLQAYRAAGIDIKKAAQESILFNISLAKTKFTFEALYKSVALRFLPMLTNQLDIFRKQIYDNMPRIQHVLERFIQFLFKVFQATVTLGYSAWEALGKILDVLSSLHKVTGGWSTIILGIATAWKVLSATLLSSPLGLLLTLAFILLTLYDDYQHFVKYGRKNSLFDWGPAIKFAKQLKEELLPLTDALKTLYDTLKNLKDLKFEDFLSSILGILEAFGNLELDALNKLFYNMVRLADKLAEYTVKNAPGAVYNAGNKIADGIVALADQAASGVVDFASSLPSRVSSNLNTLTYPNISNPVGSSNINNRNVNQNVSQENNIIVQGSADALSTGKAVLSQFERVNFDIARYLGGVAR